MDDPRILHSRAGSLCCPYHLGKPDSPRQAEKKNRLLWREDGEWLISVAGFANTSVIPAELIGALDTISFIRPSGTPAAPYTVSAVSPSPGPSPSVTES